MSDQDLIRRGDALERFPEGRQAWPAHRIRSAIDALPAVTSDREADDFANLEAMVSARDAKMRADGRKEGLERANQIGLDMLGVLNSKPGSAARSAILEYRAAIRAAMGGEA
jgi:hypothetical protein